MPRFIFFKGLYSTLDLYTDEMLRICRERGYDSFVLHTTQGEDASCMHISEEQEKEEREDLLRFLKEPVTAAVGFGNMGLRYEMDGIGNIWDAFAVPYIDVTDGPSVSFFRHFPVCGKTDGIALPGSQSCELYPAVFPGDRVRGFPAACGDRAARREKADPGAWHRSALCRRAFPWGGRSYGAGSERICRF